MKQYINKVGNGFIFLHKILDKLQFLYYNGNGAHLYVVLKTR